MSRNSPKENEQETENLLDCPEIITCDDTSKLDITQITYNKPGPPIKKMICSSLKVLRDPPTIPNLKYEKKDSNATQNMNTTIRHKLVEKAKANSLKHSSTDPKPQTPPVAQNKNIKWFSSYTPDESTMAMMIKQIIVISVRSTIITVEFILGYQANSIAIISDASHQCIDLIGFCFSFVTVYITTFKPSLRYSYGYHRSEVLGSMLSIILLFFTCGVQLYHAVLRIMKPPENLKADFMFYAAIVSGLSNFIILNILNDNAFGSENVNENAAELQSIEKSSEEKKRSKRSKLSSIEDFLLEGPNSLKKSKLTANQKAWLEKYGKKDYNPEEDSQKKIVGISKSKDRTVIKTAKAISMGDLFNCLNIIVGSIVIWINPNQKIIDPICTIVFVIIVLNFARSIVIDAIRFLMDATPVMIDIDKFKIDLEEIKGVEAIHDQHIWSLVAGKMQCSFHLNTDDSLENCDPDGLLRQATIICRNYGIFHSSIQIEKKYKQNLLNGEYYIDCTNNIHE